MLLEHGRPLLVFICSGFTLSGLQTHGRSEKLNGIQQTGDKSRIRNVGFFGSFTANRNLPL
jgi:hypothetical protein